MACLEASTSLAQHITFQCGNYQILLETLWNFYWAHHLKSARHHILCETIKFLGQTPWNFVMSSSEAAGKHYILRASGMIHKKHMLSGTKSKIWLVFYKKISKVDFCCENNHIIPPGTFWRKCIILILHFLPNVTRKTRK